MIIILFFLTLVTLTFPSVVVSVAETVCVCWLPLVVGIVTAGVVVGITIVGCVISGSVAIHMGVHTLLLYHLLL